MTPKTIKSSDDPANGAQMERSGMIKDHTSPPFDCLRLFNELVPHDRVTKLSEPGKAVAVQGNMLTKEVIRAVLPYSIP